jgi:hypothetical protein
VHGIGLLHQSHDRKRLRIEDDERIPSSLDCLTGTVGRDEPGLEGVHSTRAARQARVSGFASGSRVTGGGARAIEDLADEQRAPIYAGARFLQRQSGIAQRHADAYPRRGSHRELQWVGGSQPAFDLGGQGGRIDPHRSGRAHEGLGRQADAVAECLRTARAARHQDVLRRVIPPWSRDGEPGEKRPVRLHRHPHAVDSQLGVSGARGSEDEV